jgi:signal transduction histidine kinase
MTLRARLAVGLLAIAALLVAPLLIAKQSMDNLVVRIEDLSGGEVAASLLLARMRAASSELRQAELALVYAKDSTTDSQRQERVAEALLRVQVLADTLTRYGLDSTAKAVRLRLRGVDTLILMEVEAMRRQRDKRADSLSTNAVTPLLTSVESLIAVAERQISERTKSRADRSIADASASQDVADGAFAISLVLATVIAVWLTATISRPVRDLEQGMEAVADGDFTHRLTIAQLRDDEFGRLAKSYQAMASQLRQLDQLKAEFVSVASHELKTPINVIIGYLQLLQEDVYGPLTPQQREICQTLATQASVLARLVRQLLDVSRFEAGGGKLELRPIRLAAFLGEMESSFRVLAMQRGVQFGVYMGTDLPREVVWDEDRMREVLGNLLSNAFKFTERGGKVELRAISSDHRVHLAVRDSGAGIAAEQLPYIFEKFYQADNQSAASAMGAGLGLAIAKGIVSAHDGTISVESTVGHGTTFSITMPVRPVATRAAATSGHARVLVLGPAR